MANSTTHLPTLSPTQAGKETYVNGLFDAASPAATYGRNQLTCTGLLWGYFGGLVVLPDGVTASISNGTVNLTASSTNYVVALKSTGAVSFSTATTNWDSGDYWRLYSVVTGVSTVTSWTDHRKPAEYTGASTRNTIVTKTGNFTQAANEIEIICNGTASITATLLGASTHKGVKVRVKTIAAYTVVSSSSNVKPLDSDTAGTAILSATAGKWAELVSDGTNWVIMAGN